jgi:PQQ-like domain
MRWNAFIVLPVSLLAGFLFLAPNGRVAAQGGAVGVYTYHGDNKRLGWNSRETLLSHATVNATRFGKLWSRPVDGQVYAQPLYAPALSMGAAGTHNVVFVATEHNSVYAFDADTGGDTPLWQVSLGPSVPSPSVMPCRDIEGPEYGITGTPVIDPTARTLYVVAKTYENRQQLFRLHALDITTGQSRPGWPVKIAGSVAGNGGGSSGGQIAFDPVIQLQRAGLLLLNGRVVIAFGSTCDREIIRYHGWIFSYNAADPAQPPLIFNSTPDWSEGPFPESAGGIWQAGYGLAADDAGNIYFEVGNGLFNADTGGRNVGDSFVKLSTAGGGLTFTPGPESFFTPSNERALDKVDADLGSGGAMVLPDQSGLNTPHLLVGSGKDGVIRLLNRDFLGGHTGRVTSNSPDNALQNISGIGGTWCGPAYWEGPDSNYVYYTGNANRLRQFRLGTNPNGNGNAYLFLKAMSSTVFGAPRTNARSLTPVISSNGRSAGTGIVWILRRDDSTLHAYNAEDVATQLWSSGDNTADALDGGVVKFSLPIVANGKLYAGTKTSICCYGLRQGD